MRNGEAAMLKRQGGNQAGFTYIGAMLLLAVMGAVLASVGTVWHTASQREKERELLYAGGQIRQAIAWYYEQSPGGAKQYPRAMDDLLLDRRHATLRRHLRKIYVDPMTGKAEWALLRDPLGGIVGVHSLSEAKALKTSNFSRLDRDFEGRTLVAEWQFAHGAPAPAGGATPLVQR